MRNLVLARVCARRQLGTFTKSRFLLPLFLASRVVSRTRPGSLFLSRGVFGRSPFCPKSAAPAYGQEAWLLRVRSLEVNHPVYRP